MSSLLPDQDEEEGYEKAVATTTFLLLSHQPEKGESQVSRDEWGTALKVLRRLAKLLNSPNS